MIVKPTPIATPAMPTSVCRTRAVTWVHAISSRRFMAIGSRSHLRPGALSAVGTDLGDIAARIAHDRVDMGGHRGGDYGVLRIGGRDGDAGSCGRRRGCRHLARDRIGLRRIV